MKNFLIQVGVVVSLAGAAALPAAAEHRDPGFAFEIERAPVQYKDGYRQYDWRDYRYGHDIRHARKHKKKHRKQHRRNVVSRWHWRNDYRWDGYYYDDHADIHHDRRHSHWDFHRRQRHRW